MSVSELPTSDFLRGSCHCGAVTFKIRLPGGIKDPRRCDCSYCRMRGAVVTSVGLTDIEILSGKDKLTLYQFNTGQAKHYFCSICGIYTHHSRRSNPTQLGINVACLEGVSPFDFKEVIVYDGVHHPSDGASGFGGILRFEKL